MKHRIFVAIPISEALQEEIVQWEKVYQELPVRWISGKNLHITLVPPWYEEDISHVDTLLRVIAEKQVPHVIHFHSVSFGPRPVRDPKSKISANVSRRLISNGARPKQFRLIWAEGRASRELSELKEELGRARMQKGDSRPWVMHLTLARFRPKTFSSFSIKNLHEKVHWEEEVRSMVLMESHLSKEGADYEILKEYPFYSKKPT